METIKLANTPITLELATGDLILVNLESCGAGDGFRVKIASASHRGGRFIVLPSSGNSIEVTTQKALEAEEKAWDAIKAAKAKPTP